MTTTPPTHTDDAHLKRVLGLPSTVLFGVAYMVPLTVFSTLGIVAEITDNHVPAAYLVTLVVMLFTAVSYGHMSRVYPVSGSAYTYTQQSFGGAVGFLAGWALLLDYLLLPMINYMLLGLYLNIAFPAVPGWVWFVGFLALVTVLNALGITSVARMNTILIVVQLVFAVTFIVLGLQTAFGGAAPVDPLAPFVSDGMQWGAVFTGAAILCLSFLGFDAVSTLSEETRNPRRTIPIAILLVTLSGGLIFIVLAWVSGLVIPDWRVFTDVDTASNEVIAAAGGGFLSSFFIAALIAGATGSALAAQASVARILYTMGRDGVLPRAVFGVLGERSKTPVRAIVVVALVSLVGLALPLDLVVSIVSFGALAGFSMVNLSVVKTHFIDRRRRDLRGTLVYLVVPLIAFGLTVWLWTSLPGGSIVVGIVWLVVGVGILAFITRGFRRPAPKMDMRELA